MRDKLAIIFGSFAFLLLFVWFAVRPSYIKHTCSWVSKHSEASPERPAMTKEQLVAQGIIRSCEDEIDELKKVMPDVDYQLGDFSVITKDMRTKNGGFQSLFDDPLWKATSCIEQGNKVIKDYKNSIPAQPEKNWKVQATDEEYKFCLRDKGL